MGANSCTCAHAVLYGIVTADFLQITSYTFEGQMRTIT